MAACIGSVFAASSHCGWRTSLWIVLVADSCSDNTAKMARKALGSFGQVVEVCARSPQAAHLIGSGLVLEHFSDIERHAILLTSTNAVDCVPRGWIENQLHHSRTLADLTIA